MGYANVFLIVVALVMIAMIYVRRKFAYWTDRHVDHISPSFPFGNIKGAGRTHALHEIFQTFYTKMKSSTKHGFLGIYFSISPAVLALDLDFVKNVMVKDFQHFHDRGVYHNERDDPLTAHLFAIDGQKWKVLRNKLSPTFTSGKMKMMFPTIVKISEEFKSTMAAEVKRGKDFEMLELLARFTTDVIGTCAFGLDCNSLKDPDAEFRRYGKRVFGDNFMKQIFCTQFKGLARSLRTKIVPPEVTTFFMNAVRETIAFREANNEKRNDFMDLMIEMKNSEDPNNVLSFDEIAAQAFVFFLAGFETSSTVMVYTLYELAQNQKLQQRARECVQEVLKKHNGVMDYDSMMEMTYINQCLNESMRKYPPVPDLIRVVTENYRVPNSKVVLSKGITVLVPVYAIHHDPEIYDNPSVFDPERFTPENEAKRHSCAFLPFGEGPRNCIGLRFGLMQARIGMAMLLNNFRFELSDKSSGTLQFVKNSPVLSPLNGIWLKAEAL